MDFSPLGLASDGQTCDRANWRLVRGKKLTVAWHKLPPCECCEMGTAGSPYFFFETLLGNKYDELVKSHIPYVVHASTKPVLSEPFVPSRASGRTVVSECPERSRRTGSRLRANGEPKGSCFDKLSTNGISIGYPALRGIHPEP